MIKFNLKTMMNKGYTLLFAVLVSSIVLSIGISILTISKKEVLLASSARDSMLAFYSADSGMECVRYWDVRGTISSSTASAPQSCADTADLQLDSAGFHEYTSKVWTASSSLKLGNSGQCAVVTVQKTYGADAALGRQTIKTTIDSRGYNIGWDNATSKCNTPSPRRVERGLRLVY